MALTYKVGGGLMGLEQTKPPVTTGQPVQGQPQSNIVQPTQQPTSKEMSAQPKAQAKTGNEFNGDITIDGKKVKVTDGIVEGGSDEPGKKVFVSADGKVVWDNQGKILGSINAQGTFVVVTKEQIDELTKAGVLKPGTQNVNEQSTNDSTSGLSGEEKTGLVSK